MRLLISFLLSLFFYLVIIYFFVLAFNKKPSKKEEVLIHTAIISSKKAVLKPISKKSSPKSLKIKKSVKKIIKSSSSLTKGGNSDFKDIFKKVPYNVDNQKLNLKKQLNLSRFKGIEKNLKKIKFINFDISYVNSGEKINKKEIKDLITKKLGPIWYSISDIVGEYAKINIISNGNTEVYIIDTNLPQDKQNLLIERIKELKFNKKFNITVKFVTKVKK